MLFIIFVFLIFSITSCYSLINDEILRVIDATSSIVTITMDIKASDVESSYDIMFPNHLANKLAFISVNSGSKKLDVSAPVQDTKNSIFTVDVGGNKKNKSKINIKVSAVFTEALVPYPAEITQLEKQLVQFTDSHYITTPYHTESQKTVVKLASNSIESFTKLEPTSQRGTTITFGPYKSIAALEYSYLMIHSVNNKPFAKFSQAEREIEVSHWGNIAVEETYELKHVGAKLIGGFSRFDYQSHQVNRAQDYPVFTSLTAYLPLESRNIYYRDQIGNISTSDISVNNGELNMEVATRFPLFGGWKTEFYIGYSVPTSVALTVDADIADRYSLSFNYFTIFDNVWVDDMEIKIILPEGCSNIDVSVPYEISEQTFGRRFTYLDTQLNGGRPVITIKAKNVVAEHDDEIKINYTFNQSRMYVEPMLLIGMIFIVLTISSVIAYVNSNGSDSSDSSSSSSSSSTADKSKNQ